MILVKKDSANFSPAYGSDYEEAKKIRVGEMVKVSRARNVQHNKKFFAILHVAHENQDRYADFEVFRQITLLRAGHYQEVPTKTGETYFLPKSISFEKLPQAEFEQVYQSVLLLLSRDMGIPVEELENESKNFM